MQYAVNFPNHYIEGKKYPVILFLHGAGSRGNDINKIINNPYFTEAAGKPDFPFISVVPQCHENTWFDVWERLKALVNDIANLPFADKGRIYVMGASMGGYATWQLAMSMADYFAAVVPICGGGMYWNAGRLVNVPIWAFHGAKDTTVLLEESIKMVDAVKCHGGDAKLTVYPENGHNAWSDTYADPEVFSWLLQHRNRNNQNYDDAYNEAEMYG